ncbi:MAG: TlpA disulfide reductase family protein [Acidobacteriota bacterium]
MQLKIEGKFFSCLLLLVSACALGQADWPDEVRQRIHREVRRMLESEKQRVLFSEIHSSPEFSQAEKAYAGRLYEVFFAIPASLKTVWESEQRPPTRQELSAEHGVEPKAVDLLLNTMTTDPRMPRLIKLDPASGEIASIDLEATRQFVQTRGSSVRITGWEGTAFPDFNLQTFEGQPFQTRRLKGKAVLVWIWATRCPVCQRMAPSIVELARKFQGEHLAVVGFNLDQALGLSPTDQERLDYARQKGMQFANLLLDEASWKALGRINIVPSVFLVDRQGNVQRLFINIQEPETLEEAVEQVLRRQEEGDSEMGGK